jgi:Family of unknown function (DUF5681)
MSCAGRGRDSSIKAANETGILRLGERRAEGNVMAKKEIKVVSGLEPTVGPGNPPKDTRFPKGKSGNPQGRPRGTKNLKTMVMEAARKPITVEIDGKQRTISTLQATTLQLALKAGRGEPKAMVQFLDRVDEIETSAAAAKPPQFPLEPADVEVLRAVYERMKQCAPDENAE